MEPLDPTDLMDLYWAGRTTLVTRREHIPIYHRVFRELFLGVPGRARRGTAVQPPRRRRSAAADLQLPEPEQAREESEEQEARMGLVGSDVGDARAQGVRATARREELAALRRIMRTVRLTPAAPALPSYGARAGRRTGPTCGVPSARRCAPTATRRRCAGAGAGCGPRPLVLVLDVSGSMADYSRALLQFAHVTSRATAKVEVFCFGTRLTRITRELEHRRPDEALDRAARAVVDWEGGTRIGASLDAFVRDWGRRGLGRGGIVVICSDGLDRGDPALLESAMQRLSRLSHRVVWLNPHAGTGAPASLGMAVAAPYVDEVLSARTSPASRSSPAPSRGSGDPARLARGLPVRGPAGAGRLDAARGAGGLRRPLPAGHRPASSTPSSTSATATDLHHRGLPVPPPGGAVLGRSAPAASTPCTSRRTRSRAACRGHRAQLADELSRSTSRSATTSSSTRRWQDHWIGSYDAPTTGPLTTGRSPDQPTGS